ncbi:MAG: hypothetical protein KGZ25_09620, partial [Planctomycetes bacterium]|nr:hypothetical protein [Planctomycetota bacterium]
FRQPGYETRYETPEKWGSKIIKIPENVPRGKVAIMEVDVTGKEGEEWHRIHQEEVTVEVKGIPGKVNLIVQIHDPAEKTWFKILLRGSRKGSFKVRELGGEMTVIREDRPYAQYYVRKIDKHKLVVPRDADIVATEEKVVKFHLPVEKEKLPESVRAFWLFVDKDDVCPVAAADTRVFTGVKEHRLAEKATLQYAPGTYYVAYGQGQSNDPHFFGKVTIAPESEGKTLEVELLEE